MYSKLMFLLFSFAFCTLAKSQLSLSVKEIDYKDNIKYIPKFDEVENREIRHKGHILEVSVKNLSNKNVSLPIDTLSYVIPYTDDVRLFYSDELHVQSDPDVFNVLGVYPFVFQDGKFISCDIGPEPFYEDEQWGEKFKIEDARKKVIENWKKGKNINDDLEADYNWYIMNNMVTIPAKQVFKFKLYFNPFLKLTSKYGYREYYYKLDSKKPMTVNFKLILPKGIYKFLSKDDKKKYKNLFTGIVESNNLVLSTK